MTIDHTPTPVPSRPTARRAGALAVAALALAGALAACGNSTDSAAPTTTTGPNGAGLKTADPADAPFCERFLRLQVTFGGTANDDPAKYKTEMADLTANAPAAVKADMAAFNTFVQSAGPGDLSASKLTPEARDAATRIATWSQVHCKQG